VIDVVISASNGGDGISEDHAVTQQEAYSLQGSQDITILARSAQQCNEAPTSRYWREVMEMKVLARTTQHATMHLRSTGRRWT
jgi:hypothetical protein